MSGSSVTVPCSIFCKGVVRVAIEPALARLGRRNHRVSALAGVFARVAVWRAITAKGRPALLTRAQVDPLSANPYALSTLATPRLFHRRYRRKMSATSVRHRFTSLSDRDRPREIGRLPCEPASAARRHNAPALQSAPGRASEKQSHLNLAPPLFQLSTLSDQLSTVTTVGVKSPR